VGDIDMRPAANLVSQGKSYVQLHISPI
jgi:hypothetical protein